MPSYLSVVNWSKYQHYKDRCPPWIKIHLSTLSDYAFTCLPDASKAHLILIWLLASRTENRFYNDPRWIQKQIGTDKPPNIKALITAGFLTMSQDASNPLAECLQDAPLTEERRGEESNRGEQSREDCPEPEADSTPPSPSVMSFVTVGKTKTWDLTQSLLDEWRVLFPGVDVLGECRSALAWTNANPTKRKTVRGMERFLVGWLVKEQNRSRR